MKDHLNRQPADPYSKVVRGYFATPAHAVRPAEKGGAWHAARRGEFAQGAVVEFKLRVEQGLVGEMRFKAYGCPYLIAAAERACEQYEGRPVTELGAFSATQMLGFLSAPVERMARMLLVEDALHLLADEIKD